MLKNNNSTLCSKSLTCPICESKREHCFTEKLMHKYEVQYLYCDSCGLLQTEEPYWLNEAYENAIADADTGLTARNIAISRKLACVLFLWFPRHGKYLDNAGGYGMLTRLMRDIGFDFYWFDQYCENYLAKGFERDRAALPFSAVTAFEVLEHVSDPLKFIGDSLKESQSSTMIFSTELFVDTPPRPNAWQYYAFATGQHISFYQKRTLQVLAQKLSLNFYSSKGLHIITDRVIKNQTMFDVMTGIASHFFVRYVQKKLGSKTQQDYDCMMALSKPSQEL
jgi:hypothetical protein